VLRSCVHCGFCNATCPTYQLLGDELDGPRGRIYQIKQILEGAKATTSIQQHLDRCLTCRACETTCPSGVEYHKLLDIGRELVEQQVPRPVLQRSYRRLLQYTFSETRRVALLSPERSRCLPSAHMHAACCYSTAACNRRLHRRSTLAPYRFLTGWVSVCEPSPQPAAVAHCTSISLTTLQPGTEHARISMPGGHRSSRVRKPLS